MAHHLNRVPVSDILLRGSAIRKWDGYHLELGSDRDARRNQERFCRDHCGRSG